MSPTANQHDAIELALADYQEGFGHPLSDLCEIDVVTGEIKPVVTVVTNNGGPFRSFLFEAFMLAHRDLAHVPPGARAGQNGSRERGFRTFSPSGSTSTRSTTPSCSPSTPRSTGSSKHHPAARGTSLEPAAGGAPRDRRPDDSHLPIQEIPDNFLTQDTTTPPMPGRSSSLPQHASPRFHLVA